MAAKAKSKRYEEKLNSSLSDPAINPAMMFLSGAAEPRQQEQISAAQPAPGLSLLLQQEEDRPRAMPRRRETRSRRANLLFPPSLFEKLAAVASSSGISMNEYVIYAVDNALKNESG
jgi:predicted HicB family RNase H-like nuclease